MSAPRIDIINAIFDSYLTMRNAAWHLYDEASKEIKRPSEEKARKKSEIVTEFIRDAAKCSSTQDWMNYSAKLYEVEKVELQTYNNRSFLVKPFLDWPMLELTFKAIRSYVYSQVKNDRYMPTPELQGYMSSPEARNDKYHEEYFAEFIKKRDHRALGETSFKDFTDNVTSGVRKTTIAELLSSPPQPTVSVVAKLTGKSRSDVAPALKAAEECRTDLTERSVAIDKLLQDAQEKVAREKAEKENAEQEKARIAAEEEARRNSRSSKIQRTYADVASSKTVATEDIQPATEPRPARTRRQSVTFNNGVTLFSSSARSVNAGNSGSKNDVDSLASYGDRRRSRHHYQ